MNYKKRFLFLVIFVISILIFQSVVYAPLPPSPSPPGGNGGSGCVGNVGDPCGTCNTGRVPCGGGCAGDHCTHSPGCSPTSQYRCVNGKQERRTRGTNCCGGCSGWSGWSVSDDCPSHDAWCRNNACVDCDTDLDICITK